MIEMTMRFGEQNMPQVSPGAMSWESFLLLPTLREIWTNLLLWVMCLWTSPKTPMSPAKKYLSSPCFPWVRYPLAWNFVAYFWPKWRPSFRFRIFDVYVYGRNFSVAQIHIDIWTHQLVDNFSTFPVLEPLKQRAGIWGIYPRLQDHNGVHSTGFPGRGSLEIHNQWSSRKSPLKYQFGGDFVVLGRKGNTLIHLTCTIIGLVIWCLCLAKRSTHG